MFDDGAVDALTIAVKSNHDDSEKIQVAINYDK